MDATEFRIVISRTHVSCRVRAPGSDAFVEIKPPDDDQIGFKIASEHLRTVQVLEEWLKRWQLMTSLDEQDPPRPGQILFVPETIDLLGSYLWQMVLKNKIGDAIVAQFGTPVGGAGNMRVRISFEDAPELALLPWEFLRFSGGDGQGKFWLAAEAKLVLGRFVDGPGNIEIKLADEWLRAVLVRHLPAEPHFNAQREACDELAAALLRADETQGRVRVKVVDRWSTPRLREAMRAFHAEGHPVDVVHLTALFRMKKGACQVKLPGSNGKDDWTAAETLVDNICEQDDNRPTLVVLHLIDQADGDFMQHSEQLAPAFIAGGVPAVLAMQYPMTTQEAHKFLMHFYGALAHGSPIGKAVQLSRKEIRLAGLNRHFGSPVLYMQSDSDGRLIDIPQPESSSEQTSRPERAAASAARPAPERSRRDVENRLLHVLDSVEADTKVIWKLRADIRREDWPADDGAARQLVLQMFRGKQDDVVLTRIYERLLAELTGPMKAGL